MPSGKPHVVRHQGFNVSSILVVDFLDPSVSEGQFPHPIDSTSHCRRNMSVLESSMMTSVWLDSKAIICEIVVDQLLAIVICGDVVYMHCITVLSKREVSSTTIQSISNDQLTSRSLKKMWLSPRIIIIVSMSLPNRSVSSVFCANCSNKKDVGKKN